MAQFFSLHPQNPQARLIQQSVKLLQKGGVIAYPTDSGYALGCMMDNSKGLERIRRIRRVEESHNFTLVCSDLSDLGIYARTDNTAYRLMKRHTPGAYTFILPATREVPRRMQNPKRKTIGLRVPDFPIVTALLSALGEPIMSSTLILPDQEFPLSDAQSIREQLEHEVDLIIDGGICALKPTSVIGIEDGAPVVYRQGQGDIDYLLSD